MADTVLHHWESSLGQFHRVWLSDGRVIAGRLLCVDYLKNLILNNTIELRPPLPPEQLQELDLDAGKLREFVRVRHDVIVLGQIMVRGQDIVKIERKAKKEFADRA
jgi:small nuclear ribonucleoprotein (snRNP)-like protein